MDNTETTQEMTVDTTEIVDTAQEQEPPTPLEVATAATGEDSPASDDAPQDTFPREYVEKLRKENATYRERAKRSDELAHRLFNSLVAADGRLADPNDLEFDETLLNDPDAMAAAIGDLVARKPGLKARQFGGDVGAGARGAAKQPPADLISIIRGVK